MPDKSTASEFVSSPDRLTRFWIALCAACIVFGGWLATLSINQTTFQHNQVVLQEGLLGLKTTMQDLAVQGGTTAIQTKTYQNAAIRRDSQQDQAIDRITDLLNQLIQQSL